MDIGLHAQEDFEEFRRLCEIIERLPETHNVWRDRIDPLGEDTDLGAIEQDIDSPWLPITPLVNDSLVTSAEAVEQVRLLVTTNALVTPVVFRVLLRAALVSAGRVVFMLGPDDHGLRTTRSRLMLHRDLRSAERMVKDVKDFQTFTGVCVAEDFNVPLEPVASVNSSPGDGRVLQAMADEIERVLIREGYPVKAGQLREHVIWMFHLYSGHAHGHAWPRAIGEIGYAEALYLADLSVATSVVEVAHDLAIRRA